MNKSKIKAIAYAILAAVFYAMNIPVSKVLLTYIEPTMMASILYLGAGVGIGVLFLMQKERIDQESYLDKKDLPYTVGMIVLDIIAPILLMFGLRYTSSANVSLLNNFEIVATAVIAFVLFKEMISKRVWIAIVLITLSSIILSFEDITSIQFSSGSLLVLLAALCWGLENNCTRQIASKNTYEIVMVKGICSGLGSMIIAIIMGESIPQIQYWGIVLVLGFVAYGLSIFFYILAQEVLGAAKTSAYYAIAPFVGVLLSVLLLQESITIRTLIALTIMIMGSTIVVIDTLLVAHKHMHSHSYTHTHDGTTHTHTIAHSHVHYHMMNEKEHIHVHR